jgi:hypothetical protein
LLCKHPSLLLFTSQLDERQGGHGHSDNSYQHDGQAVAGALLTLGPVYGVELVALLTLCLGEGNGQRALKIRASFLYRRQARRPCQSTCMRHCTELSTKCVKRVVFLVASCRKSEPVNSRSAKLSSLPRPNARLVHRRRESSLHPDRVSDVVILLSLCCS